MEAVAGCAPSNIRSSSPAIHAQAAIGVRSRHKREPRSDVRHQVIAILVVRRSQASLNFEEPALQALIASLPEAPAAARLRCLEMCGLDTGDDLSLIHI